MSDAAFLFHVLEDGKWHAQHEILRRSQDERGHGLTVHSRAADLRKRGCVVECELRRNGHGRSLSYYRLVSLADGAGAGLASSASVPAGTDHSPDDGSLDGLPPSVEDGTLPLFACVVDESAGMRGAYSEPDAA